MEARYIDLHLHSTASDGTVEPDELVRLAAQEGLSAVALTDHDTVSGICLARETAKCIGLEFIAGCEIAVRYPEGEIHLIGLWVPDENAELLDFLANEKARRRTRNSKIMDRLSAMGVKISPHTLDEQFPGQSVGRPHIARVLIEEGYASSIQDAFKKYLGSKGAAYVPKELVTPEEGVEVLSSFGASVFIAHPRLGVTMSKNRLDSLIRRLKPKGLAGLEVYHSSHNEDDVKLCLGLVEQYNLLISGGSDFHGLAKPNVNIGQVNKGEKVEYTLLEKIKEERVRKGLPV